MQNALSYAWYFDQIFIVDNTEGDNSSLAAQIPNAIYIPNGKNLGIAKALNQGIEAALIENTKGRDYRWVMTMDQDSAWDHDQLTQYISACIEMNGQDSAIKSFAPTTKQPSSNCQRHSTLGIWKRKLYALVTKKQYQEKKHAVDFGFMDSAMCSGNVIEIKVWEQIGKFEEELFLYRVDTDFSLRVWEAGYKIYKFRDIYMKHQLSDYAVPFKQTFLPSYLMPTVSKGHKYGDSEHNDPVRFFYLVRCFLYIKKRHPSFANKKVNKKWFRNNILSHCVFNRKALRNIKVLIRAYKDYKQTLLPLIENERNKE